MHNRIQFFSQSHIASSRAIPLLKTRIQTVMKRYGLDEKAAKRRIEQTDRRRADNYRYYTRRIWGMSGNYQMCIDTSLGEDYVINTVLDLVKNVNRHVSESRAE